jgi:hypothetical protein
MLKKIKLFQRQGTGGLNGHTWGGVRPVTARYLAKKFAAELQFITILQKPGSRRT